MICKECGAYNPDHATYCKVCAANLKGEPEVAAPAEAEVEQQPTKRFSRPSWIVPEQAEAVKEEAVEAAESVAEDVAENVDNAVDQVEEAVEEAAPEAEIPEVEEETPVPIWSPTKTRRRAEVAEEDEESNEEENDAIYNDEEALEDSDDSFEYEPTPPKRKTQKKKNNTLFTVLLIAIIVVIVGILVLGGYMLLKNQLNCGKTPEKTNGDAATASELNPVDPNAGEQAGTNPNAGTESPAALDSRNAQLQELRDENNNDMIAITVVVPANSTVTIDFPNQDDYQYQNSDAKDVTRKVKIPVEVFYPNQPLDEATMEIRPDIAITGADGSSYKVECPSFTRTFPKLNITVTAPVANEEGVIMAPESNVISLEGTIDDPGAEVSINGVVTPVYMGGVFMDKYEFGADATEDTVDTITIVAKKNNFVTDTKEITVHAYKYIPEPMKLEVKTEGAALNTDKNGKLTVTGTTLPGATLTAVSDNSTNVLCGSVNVDPEGNFSFQITTDASFYGMSTITLDASKEGADSATAKFTIKKGFADKEAFVKFYNKTKTYIELPKHATIQQLLANQAQYATNGYGFRISAQVVEVLPLEGDTIVKMTILKTNETVYVHNLSGKWAPGDNVGSKYNIYCNFIGTYEDTGCCEFIGWFAKVIK